MSWSVLADWIDLSRTGLAAVQTAVSAGQPEEAYAALKAYYAARAASEGWEGHTGQPELLSRIRTQYADAAQEALASANRVTDQTFLFRGAWDMEPTSVPVTFSGPIDWEHVAGGDVEWAYMLNRHSYWIDLGQAYRLTGDDKYAAVFVRQLDDWLRRNPVPSAAPGARTLTWRTIEAGLRCTNWTRAIGYFIDSPHLTPELFVRMLYSLYEHGVYLASIFDGWRRMSNWGVLESAGLYAAAAFAPELRSGTDWLELSAERLRQTAELQVLKDGMHWEQSPLYHNEVLFQYMHVLHLAQRYGRALKPGFVGVIRQMAYADLYLAKPNGRQPMRGDSDNNDLRDALTAAAVLLEDRTLKFGGHAKIDLTNLWQFGLEGAARYERMTATEPPHESFPFTHIGEYVMRSGWAADAKYAAFHCGMLGGGHGHADMLHIDIQAFGKDLLLDPGRFTYVGTSQWRSYFKRSAAHNTTVVDSKDFTEYVDTWEYGRVANPLATRWVSESSFDYAEGSHDGYLDEALPVVPKRRLLFIKPHFWVLIDSFRGHGIHTLTQHFHFAPGHAVIDGASGIHFTTEDRTASLHILSVEPENTGGEELASDAERSSDSAAAAATNTPKLRLATSDMTRTPPGPLRVRKEDGFVSYQYNAMTPAPVVSCTRQAEGFGSIMQVLVALPGCEAAIPRVEKIAVFTYMGDQVGDDTAEACRIVMPDSDESYIVVVCHRTPSLNVMSYIVDGIQIFGEVVWMKRTASGTETTVVR